MIRPRFSNPHIFCYFYTKSLIMTFPEELKYTKDHEWVKLEGDNALIGITEFAQRELGDIVFVDITTQGESLDANEIFGSVEAVKTVSDLYLPLAGTVSEVNAELETNPEFVNQDPYGKGWMIRLKVDSSKLDDAELMDAAAYKDMVGV